MKRLSACLDHERGDDGIRRRLKHLHNLLSLQVVDMREAIHTKHICIQTTQHVYTFLHSNIY